MQRVLSRPDSRAGQSGLAHRWSALRWCLGAEARFVGGVAGLLFVVTSLPYAFAYLSSPPDLAFSGLTYTTHDYAQYQSWARESRAGLFVENKLTPEHTAPTFFNLFWWLVGRLEGLAGLSFVQLNHAARLLSGLAFVAAVAWFFRLVLPDRQQARFAVLLCCLTSGFGWVLVVLKPLTGDLLNPLLVHTIPGNTFFGLMVVPHHVLAAALHVAIFALALRARARDESRPLILAGLLGLALGFSHAYDLVTTYAVLAGFALLVLLRDGPRRRWLVGLAAFYGLSAPAPLYWAFVSAQSPDWRQVLAQYRNLGVFTPDPLQLVVLLGPTFLLALAAQRGLAPHRQARDAELLLGCWFIANLFLIYLPVNFQIMMLNGYQVPLAALATAAIYGGVLPWLRERPAGAGSRLAAVGAKLARRAVPLVPLAFLLLVVPTNLYLLSWRIYDLNRHTYPDYLARGDVAAIDWLESTADREDVVLSSLPIGHFLPGWTGAHAYLAHGAGTLDFQARRAAVQRFYSSATDAERALLLRTAGVRWVFYGPAERTLGDYDPAFSPDLLERAFSAGSTSIYRVRP